MASFYLSNDEWDKGEEITLFDMSSEEDEFSPLSMGSTSIFQIYEKTNKILIIHLIIFLHHQFENNLLNHT